MTKIFASLAVCVALFAATATELFATSISVNYASGTGGAVSGTVAGGGETVGNWINITGFGNNANYAASADGSGWTSGTMTGSQAGGANLDSAGNSVGALRTDFYDGGWGQNFQWNNSGVTAGTPGRSGVANNFGSGNATLYIGAIPTAYTTAGYDLWIMSAVGNGNVTAWSKFVTNGHAASYETGKPISVSAFQITMVPEPGTIVLLGTGLLGLLAYAWRRRRA